ncbi:hypothetical protein AALP_AA5G040400 [Arabis alpina]|uniref:ACT domain-containing protein n=1 Tax=Arabis alpina TaxID=50452 RepID=A0A087GUU1_ARAAL|nr:hypothetical protein AALP_AA5G040400 [Arabis alpina]
MCQALPVMVKDEGWKETVHKALLEAVENGNNEFFIEIIKHNPQLLWISEATSGRNLFQLAVGFRRETIFNLIYGLDDRKVSMLRSYDQEHNNILHIAAYLSPSDHLSKVAGAALKMQRETQWFEEVKSLLSEREVLQKNKGNMTPRQVFEASHELLRKEGEEWMKSTATACSFVAALIATVTFQAIFTIPGGNDESLGVPVLRKDSHFMAFIVVDALSFFASCTSVLIFLSILTTRYSFDDFFVSLPRKMILGLTILFIAIAAMLVSFTTALFTSMGQKSILAVSVVPLAYLPFVLFFMLHCHKCLNWFFLCDIRATGRKVEDPDSLEQIRLTIINNLLKYHPECSEQLAMGETFGIKAPEKKLDVDIATHIHVKEDGPKRSLLCIETADRPGLVVEMIKVMADINIDVESAEIDTEGLVAKDKFHVSYQGQALNNSLSQVLVNCLRYFLRRPETDIDSY